MGRQAKLRARRKTQGYKEGTRAKYFIDYNPDGFYSYLGLLPEYERGELKMRGVDGMAWLNYPGASGFNGRQFAFPALLGVDQLRLIIIGSMRGMNIPPASEWFAIKTWHEMDDMLDEVCYLKIIEDLKKNTKEEIEYYKEMAFNAIGDGLTSGEIGIVEL